VVEQLRLGLQIMALHALGDPEAAEEAVQETLVRALEALRNGRPRDPEKLGAFVRGIARHVIADAHHARQRSAPLDAVPETERGIRSDDPLSALITDEERNRVRRALARLSPADRDILHLSFFEGLTPVEIAERIGEPALRIRKRKSRALRRLREAFSRGAGTGHESGSSKTDE
jgi:RNA polymerase sigma-70 factor (ECF subfamily)